MGLLLLESVSALAPVSKQRLTLALHLVIAIFVIILFKISRSFHGGFWGFGVLGFWGIKDF